MEFIAKLMKPIQVQLMPVSTSQQWNFCRIPFLGVAIICAIVAALSACQPGSSEGGGIDPGIIQIPIAFIKRPIPVDDMGVEIQADLREPLLFSAGGDLYLRTSTAASASITNITRSVTLGSGDIKGLNSSYDGTKLIFSLRLFDPNPNDEVVPSWNIYEYDLVTESLRRIIVDVGTAELGDDLFPGYLPDGRIVFTSSRQKQASQNLINEGKPGYQALDEDRNILAMTLHVMNSDGTSIRQISLNLSHDLYPQVLSRLDDGKIIFSRWDNAVGDKGMHFYTVNPDGSELELLYGRNSHNTGSNGAEIQFGYTREMQNGDLMAITRPYSGTFDGGDIVIIDATQFSDNDKPVWSRTGLAGPAQESATINGVVNDGSVSIAGRYASAYPLWDGSNRILVSKSTCQLTVSAQIRPCVEPYLSDPSAAEAAPAYSIWLYDMNEDIEKPIVLAEQGMIITEAITIQQRDLPSIIFDKGPGEIVTAWEDDKVGAINIKSVYDLGDTSFDGCFFNQCTSAAAITTVQDFADPLKATADQRPARFVRFTRPVTFPDRQDPDLTNPPDPANNAFGLQRIRGMREIVGYAPVEPDGSVKTKVPANLPLALEVLDGEGRRIGPLHLNWLQVSAGDTLTCNGCHSQGAAATTPEIHGRSDATAPSINAGLSSSLEFANTLIPGTTNAYWGNLGQTMAEVRFDRVGLMVPPGSEPQLSLDLEYEDYWTDPAGPRAPDASYAYRYADLDISIPSPANQFCSPSWAFNCRSIINYPQQIQAIWERDRGVDLVTPEAPDNPLASDPTNTLLKVTNTPNLMGDDTCIECHTTDDGQRVAYGQLDLTLDPNQNPAQFMRSYLELFVADDGQQLVGGALVDFTVSVPDGMGGFIDQIDPAARVRPSMTVNGARASYFIEKMTGTELDDNSRSVTGLVDHTGMLDDAELKLISEWLDIGAQNFNNPFDPDAPQN